MGTDASFLIGFAIQEGKAQAFVHSLLVCFFFGCLFFPCTRSSSVEAQIRTRFLQSISIPWCLAY